MLTILATLALTGAQAEPQICVVANLERRERMEALMVEIDDLDASRKARAAFEQRAYSDGLPPLTQRVRGSDRAALISLLAAPAVGGAVPRSWGAAARSWT